MTIATITGITAAAIASGGTLVVIYPTGKDRGSFSAGFDHRLSVLGKVFRAPDDITVSFGATAATITYNGATTIPAGSRFTVQLDETGILNPCFEPTSGQQIATPVSLHLMNLGSPGAASANSILLSASVTAAVGTATALTGALVSSGVAVLDARTGRNVVGAWTGAAVLTVYGTDMYGRAISESSASGTSFTGKKAFKRVTAIKFSADVTLATVGTGTVLGLPAYTPNAAMILKESQDGAAATAGTIVAGLFGSKSTATSADVRGTYTPNAAPDGSKNYQLLAAIPDPTYLGPTQYSA